MTEAMSEEVPDIQASREAHVLPFVPEILDESEIDTLSDAECVAFLIDYARHPAIRAEEMYTTLYTLIYEDNEPVWRTRINALITADTDEIFDNNPDDEVLSTLITTLKSTQGKHDAHAMHDARKVLVALVELRCIELRDKAEGTNWAGFFKKLPDLQ